MNRTFRVTPSVFASTCAVITLAAFHAACTGALLTPDSTEDAPAGDAPVADAPMHDAPVADAHVEDAPVGDAPTHDAPLPDAPVEDAPVGEACPGPYMPASPGELNYGAGCFSAPALISCQAAAPEVGFISCFQNVRSELQCGQSGEHDCTNVCAPGEYAALCGAFDGSMPEGGGASTNADCRVPSSQVEGLSSVRYFCCTCRDE
jgi:hypothetical protein